MLLDVKRYVVKLNEPEKRSWYGMKSRCKENNTPSNKYYFARGITVCKRWLKFENFLKDMGPKPAAIYTLDRINNDKGYCKSNCRWATQKEQGNNRRNNVWRKMMKIEKELGFADKMVQLTLNVPEWVAKDLERLSAQDYLSKSTYTRKWIILGLNKEKAKRGWL